MGALLQRLRGTPWALVAIAGITWSGRLFGINGTTAALLLLLAVLFSATYASLADAVIASVVATLCLDYFFLPPMGRITIAASQDWLALFVFLTVSLVASRLSTTLSRQRDELIASHRDIEKQYALSRSMLLADSTGNVGRLVVNKLIELFGFSEAALFEVRSGEFSRSQSQSSITDDRLRQVALYGSVKHEPASGVTIIPVNLGNKTLGSLGFRGPIPNETSLQAIANTVAVGVAQAEAQAAENRASAVRKGEELKSVLIDALAHDLKTPLTSMVAASSMLLNSSLVSSEQRRELLEVIQQEVHGLKRMLGQAIHLARIDAKRLKLQLQPISALEIVQSALESLGEQTESHTIQREVPETLPPVNADRELMSQALKQLIDNAIKYSPSRSAIEISAREADGLLSLSVRDHGPGLTDLEQGRVFEKFYRGRNDRFAVQGTGMGLAIAREIVEAHGGAVAVESKLGDGTRFTITLAAAGRPVGAEHLVP